MARYFYDTEFIEDGRTIDLISIGIVAEDGREYYAVNRDARWKRIYEHEWLCEHVLPSLPLLHGDARLHVLTGPITRRRNPYALDFYDRAFRHRTVIADEVRQFLLSGDDKPELWGWYSDYDHVCLCQLWGSMADLPDGIPMYTRDLKQECDRLGNPPLPEQSVGEHNALADARHNLLRARVLDEVAAAAPTKLLTDQTGKVPAQDPR